MFFYLHCQTITGRRVRVHVKYYSRRMIRRIISQTWWTRLLRCRTARLESVSHRPQSHHGHSCFRRKLKSFFKFSSAYP